MSGSVDIPVVYEFGPFRVDPAECRLLRDGVPVALTPKAFETLVLLVSRAGHLVEKGELLREVWPDTVVEESSLSQHIYLVRKALALADEGGEAGCIQTVPKRGYRFVAPVHVRQVRSEADAAPPSVPVALSAVPVDTPVAVAAELRRPRRIPWPAHQIARRALFAGGVVVALVSAGALRRHDDTAPDAASRRPRVIAVLPFQSLLGPAAGDQFGLSLADATIGELGRLEHLSVLPTSSVFKYTEAVPDPGAAARDLAVDAVLTGTVQKLGERMRVSVQLTEGRRGVVWSQSFDDDSRNLLEAQDSLSIKVATALSAAMGGGEARARPRARAPVRPDAYDAYVRGLYFWNQRTAAGLRQAIHHFEEAVARDPNYAPAHAGLADAIGLETSQRYGSTPPTQAYERARAAARRALALDDRLAAAHTAMALVLAHADHDRREAEKEYRLALRLDPGSATALQRYARLLIEDHRLGPALEVTERALALDPLSPALSANLCYLLYLRRDYARAAGYCDKAIELQPELIQAHTTRALLEAQQGRPGAALAQLAAARGRARGKALIELLDVQGYAYARAGRRGEARAMLAELRDLTHCDDPERLSMLGIQAALGEMDDAFELLRTCAPRWQPQPFELALDPRYDRLRDDPRYLEMVEGPDSAAPDSSFGGGAGDRGTVSTLF